VLAPVGGKPYLTYLLDQLARAGVRETVLLVGYAADRVRAAFGNEFAGMTLTYSQEREPLGTAGAVRLALPLLRGETLLLLNGDSYCDVDLAAFVESHRQCRAMTRLTLAAVENTSRYGRVRTEPDGRVVGFEEKGGVSGPGHINAGVYLIQREALRDIPESRPVSLERDVLPSWVEAGRVFGFAGGRFIDIGTPESYAEVEAFFRTLSSPARGRD
jgi:NDP-sugar pyrophosphorylase family protein